MMKLVYICAPLGGDVERNIEKAKRYARFALKSDVVPIVPHYYAFSLNDNNPKERAIGATAALNLLYFCDEMWIFGNQITEGMEEEMRCCAILKKPMKKVFEKQIMKKIGVDVHVKDKK